MVHLSLSHASLEPQMLLCTVVRASYTDEAVVAIDPSGWLRGATNLQSRYYLMFSSHDVQVLFHPTLA